MITRRATFMLPLVFGKELSSGDVYIELIPEANNEFSVGVRTTKQADMALVTVFYWSTLNGQFQKHPLLLSQESTAVIMGPMQYAYSATRRAFTMPRDSVAEVRVQLLNYVGAEETIKL